MNIKKLIYRILDVLSGAAAIAWFFLPLSVGPLAPDIPARILRPFEFAPFFQELYPQSALSVLVYLIYIIPLYGLLRCFAPLLLRHLGRFGATTGIVPALLRIIVSASAVFFTVLPVLYFADSGRWFSQLPELLYITAPVIALLHIISLIIFFRSLNFSNPVYREYREFKLGRGEQKKLPNGKRNRSVVEVLFRIRTKLFLAFIGIISVILLTLSIILLNNYRSSILEAVADGAANQVQQAAASYRVNLGDNIALFEYFNRQRELNSKATFSYRHLTIYTERRSELYLDSALESYPPFRAEYSTLAPDRQYPVIDSLAGTTVSRYISIYSATRSVISLEDTEKHTISYITPVVINETSHQGSERVRRERLLGFAVLEFDEEVIMKSFFRTRNMVIIITAFFIYLSIILTYLVGNYIVNPLLFLRMNVRKISDILSTMIRGDSRVSATSLIYNDCVSSRDEIKSLSTEINEMVTVIRGIIPYISASTLKQAQKGMASSTQKELTFIFTDIRGFTTLCEGLAPDQVVEILNQYLDLETEIILNNKGDIDKFAGDEVMAFFEGPDKEQNACRAAMQICKAMAAEKERREKEGLPVISIGIGINTGNVVFGSVGARERMDFTSIGDTVNLAARLEGTNKAYGTQSLVSEAVYSRVKEQFLCREIDAITVKGKQNPVRIYEILETAEQAGKEDRKKAKLFEKGLAAYRKRDWESAKEAFRECAKVYNDEPARVFLQRITHFAIKPPPDNWDGVFRMLVK